MPQSVMWKSRVSVAQSIPVDSRKLSSFKPESVSSLHRNRCPVSAGMTVQFDPESVSSLGRNMQFLTKFNPEDVTSYEIGLKSRLFNDTLQANAAVFYDDREDMQHSVFLGGSTASSVIANVGKATVSGFELELVAQVSDPLRVFFNYGYLDPKYEKFIDGGIDVKNDRYFSYAPENTVSLGFDWAVLETEFGALDLHVDWNFKDEYTPYVTPAQQAVSQMPDHQILNARLALQDIRVGGSGQLEVALWGKNMTDEEYRIMATPFGNWTVSTFGEPRTYGLEAIYSF